MANVLVPAELMLNPKSLKKQTLWNQLNTTSWSKNEDLIEFLNEHTGHGSYFVREKNFKKLWDLLMYCSETDAIHIIYFLGLPDDTVTFLSWVYNDVAAENNSWKWDAKPKKGQASWEDLLPQMDWFPYEGLYKIFQENSREDIRVANHMKNN